MSTTSTSGASQNTSVTNCSSILCSIGPRQMTGALSSVSIPTETTRTPWARSGTNSPSMITGPRRMPIIRGIEKPHTSEPSPVAVVHSREIEDDLVDAERAHCVGHVLADALALRVAGHHEGQ